VTGAWALAFRNLRRHRRRNLVTALAVAVGYVGLAVLLGYAQYAERLLRTASVYMHHRGHLAIYAKDGLVRADAKPSAYALAPDAQEKIAAALRGDPRVAHVGRYLVGGGIAGNGCKSFPVRTVGLETDLEPRLASHPDLRAIWEDSGAALSGRTLWDAPGVDAPIVVGPRLARFLVKERPISAAAGAPGAARAGGDALDCAAPDVEERLSADPFVQLGARTQDGSFGALDGQAVGIFRAGTTEESKTGVVAPLALMQRLFDTDRVTYMAVYLHDHRHLAAVERDLAGRLAAAGVDVALYRYDDPVANPFFARSMEFIGAMVLFVGLLVANAVAFSVLNAMTLAVLERTREMGTLRALGLTRRGLRGLFLREAALLTALSAAAGAALSLAIAGLVRWSDFRFEPPGSGTPVPLQLLPSPGALVGVGVLFVLLALAATSVAVRRRARARVADLLAEVAA
jgi:putative ABC transport system permease protein